ncbi:MAG TPA: TIGR00730 family Rossman fold protein [Rhodospirillaceae bacterium]|nr:TIGR00730 family Rossman fold protein [Rhodospirillaceae bacterium]
MTIQSVCVYCGSSNRVDGVYKEAALAVGTALAEKKIHLVYGGGHVGLMGLVSDAVLAGGGTVTGIIPEHIRAHEMQHTGLTELIVVDDMHTRKNLMAEKADAFVVLPGGFGTLDEVFEILTWKQLGLHAKPVVFFNVHGFWNPAFQLIEHIIGNKFAPADNHDLFASAGSIEDMFAALNAAPPLPHTLEEKWGQ